MSALLLLAACPLAPQAAPPDVSRGNRLVKVELLADRPAIHAGESFSLGVRLKIEPAWHIYWENHGDSGYPTRARIHAPAGFTVGPALYPGPEREVSEGDIVCYVYRGEAVLLFDVQAPDPLPPGSATFDVEASWLVCTEVCYPGSGTARLEVPIGAGAAGAPANEKAFADARARLPRPWSELPGASIEWSGSAEDPIALVSVPGATDLELFPLASETTSLVERTPAQGRLTAKLRFRAASPDDSPRLAGVLRVRRAEDRRDAFYRLDSTR
jgi:DsbC/DsbD-like thiol-disulfide interchange protein